MKLSLLALILCIGLLIWNVWLQIQVSRITNQATVASNQAPLPLELKATKLEIVNDQGNAVITASADGIITANGVIVGSEKGKVSVLTEDRLEFDEANGHGANQKLTPVAVVENDNGSGKIHFYNSNQAGINFSADPTGCVVTDSKDNMGLELNPTGLMFGVTSQADANQFTPVAVIENNQGSGKLHLYDSDQAGTSFDISPLLCTSTDSKNKISFVLGPFGLDLDSFSSSDSKQSDHVAILENYQGEGKLHLYDTSNPTLSFVAWVNGILSMDHAGKDAGWEVPPSDDKSTFIDVYSKNFSTVKSDEGTFMISCQGVEPYLEGYKVHLQIGNPTAMLVANPKITVEWGAQAPKPDADAKDNDSAYKDWKKSLQQTSITLDSNLRPGFWNDVDVIVSPAKADELAYFKVSIQTDSVSLTHPPDQH